MNWENIKNSVLFQLGNFKNELEGKEREAQQKRKELTENEKKIFEISGVNVSDEEKFDWKGKKDILKLNFRGTKCDIERQILTKWHYGWNLFACLFTKKWDQYHVRDQEGRIYIDIKYESVYPLIANLKNNPRTINFVSNQLVNRTLKLFKMENVFDLQPATESRFELTGLQHSSLLRGASYQQNYTKLKEMVFQTFKESQNCNLELVESFDFCSSSEIKKAIKSYDIRFKTLLILAKVRNGPLLAIVNDSYQIPAYRYTNNEGILVFPLPMKKPDEYMWCSSYEQLENNSEKTDLKDLFPLKFIKNSSFQKNEKDPDIVINRDGKGTYCYALSPEKYFIDSCQFDKMEVYEMQRNYPPKLVARSFNPVHHSGIPTITTLHDAQLNQIAHILTKAKEHYLTLEATVEQETKNQEKEIRFLANYFYLQWFDRYLIDMDERLQSLETIQELLREITVKKTQRSTTSPIVCFRVETQDISILRSTLMRVIPDSQLTIKISGRWTMSEEEIDEEGNFIISDCPREVFDQIITSIQINYFNEFCHVLYLNAATKDSNIVEILDYFLIQNFEYYYLLNE
jgi:hypothetical protein